jgi:phage recombination protein Bet
MKDVTVVEQQQTMVAEAIDGKKIREYLEAFGLSNGMSDREVKQFAEVAQAFQLNPFKREIYCIPYGTGDRRRLSIITGYEVYLKRAERLGTLGGWKAWTEGEYKVMTEVKELPGKGGGTYKKTVRLPRGNMRAIVEIHRKDWTQAFTHEVYLDEYAQENEMWADKPRTMLKKVAIAQAFRLCFPDEMGGMPYTKDELPDEMTNVTEPTAPVQESKVLAAEAAQEPVLAPKKDPAPPEPMTDAKKDFLDAQKTIGQTMAETDNEGAARFTPEEKKGYIETAQSIGLMKDKDAKLKAMLDLKIQVQGALAVKQDERLAKYDALYAVADAAFFEDDKQIPIF